MDSQNKQLPTCEFQCHGKGVFHAYPTRLKKRQHKFKHTKSALHVQNKFFLKKKSLHYMTCQAEATSALNLYVWVSGNFLHSFGVAELYTLLMSFENLKCHFCKKWNHCISVICGYPYLMWKRSRCTTAMARKKVAILWLSHLLCILEC